MLQIDLRAPTIPQSQRVWRLFPGEGYQFLETFSGQKVGFLDLPGLVLPVGKLSDADPDDFIDRIAYSQAIKDTASKLDSEILSKISLNDYKNSRRTTHRGSIRQAVINFYQEAKLNDLVVLPEPVFNRNIWIGRFVSNRVFNGSYPKRYGDINIPSRSIEWMGSYKENTISSNLSLILRQAHPFTLLERSLHVEVFSLAYSSFIFGDRHVATIFNANDDYLDADSALLGTVSRLAASACIAMDGKLNGLGLDDILSVILASPPTEYSCSQEIDIHSAGFNRYVSGKIVSLVIAATIAALIGLSQLNSAQEIGPYINQLTVTNSSTNPDPACSARVSEATKRILTVLGIDKTWKLCEAAKAAQIRAGLRSSAQPHISRQEKGK